MSSSRTVSYLVAGGSKLPWSADSSESNRFWVSLLVVFMVFLPMAMVVPLYKLPMQDRTELETPPPVLAKVIIEKKIPPKVEEKKPEPKPEEKKEEPKPEEKKPEPEKEKKPPKEPKPEIKKKQTVDEAKKVAEQSGLLAMQDDLADMRAALDTSALNTSAKPAMAKTIAPAGATSVDKSLLSRRSGGIDTTGLAVAAETVTLSGKKATVLEARAEDKALAEATASANRGNSRNVEEIRREFDKNKSSIFSIYNRALRKNPSLKGKVLLELTIEPSGQVSHCKVLSSELDDKELEGRIVSRVKLINFGKKNIETTTIKYSLDFLPT